ncbi:MAG: alpha/beta fold hydrolase [Planctomycetota bacterium]
MMLSLLLSLLVSAGGCSGTTYLVNRSTRDNPLATQLNLLSFKGPRLSERTETVLRRYDLSDQYRQDCSVCFEHLRTRIAEDPNEELIHAFSEIAYVQGKKAEKAGRVADALNYFGITLTSSYDYLFGEQLQLRQNAFDPQFRSMCDLYNQSLEDTLRLLCSENRIKPGQTYTIETPEKTFVVRTEMRGSWAPDEFDHYEFVSDYEIQTLRNRHKTYGLGVPLIAVRKTPAVTDDRENYYPEGLSYGVTALMRCVTPEVARGGGLDEKGKKNRICVLEFFDPLVANEVQLANQWVPLETDLTTPLAYFLDSPEFRRRNAATEGLLDPNETQSNRGLYMLEPYDPKRIPVLMVHGLWSSPLTWMDMFNDLRSFPEIRDRYQFWFYLYPSGQPFWNSATQLRSDLKAMRQAFDPSQQVRALDEMVLVGHSMGGLVSRMQTIDSGDDFWRIVSDKPVADPKGAIELINGPDDDRYKLVSTLFFRPNRSVRRVITIGTPHRGSEFANDYTRWLARRFIKLPQMAISTGNRLLRGNPDLFKDTELLTMANAIDSLAPESPIFPVMLRAQRSPQVKYHNIIGVLENPSLITGRVDRGDGVVEYASARMDDVESELVVDAPHTTIHMTPKSIFEVRRILLEHLREVDSQDRVARIPVHQKAALKQSAQQRTRR